MQTVKASIFGLVFIVLMQAITLKLFSEKQKASTLIKDLELFVYVNQFDSLAFHSNLKSESDNLIVNLKTRFRDTFEHFKICETKEWQKCRIDSNTLALQIIDESHHQLIFDSSTYAGTLYYGESWDDKYIWVLFRWFKIEHKNTGVS